MTRKKKIIGLVALFFVLTVLHFQLGLFTRFNFITAYVDKWTGNERIILYGELFETDSLKSVLAPKFGFKYERKADCDITTPFVNGVNQYNEIMGTGISKRLGENWDEKLEKEVATIVSEEQRRP